MNRLDMAEQLATRVPLLAKRDKDEWKNTEKLRTGFVADYSISKIRAMSLDEYVIGKGPGNRSFCYRLEREMDSLGRILGANAFKFGIYFGRTTRDPSQQYRFSGIWGSDVAVVFPAVTEAIAKLLRDASKGDTVAIAKNRLSPMFKGKILFVYYPEQYAPIYSKEHLEHFIANLDLSGSYDTNADMQRALMKYRSSWPELRAQPALLYMRLLYDLFGLPPSSVATKAASTRLPLLDDAVEGARYIQQMPAMSKRPVLGAAQIGKTNFEKCQKTLGRIGDRGEVVAVAMERKRLSDAGRPDLAKRVAHKSQETDGAGYDILSFDEDGTARHIEVKATSARNLDRGFFISSNELEKAKALKNYYIYFVFSTLSREPRIWPKKKPAWNGNDFKLRPVTYHVTVNMQRAKR